MIIILYQLNIHDNQNEQKHGNYDLLNNDVNYNTFEKDSNIAYFEINTFDIFKLKKVYLNCVVV